MAGGKYEQNVIWMSADFNDFDGRNWSHTFGVCAPGMYRRLKQSGLKLVFFYQLFVFFLGGHLKQRRGPCEFPRKSNYLMVLLSLNASHC
jgi:hypothetical protein